MFTPKEITPDDILKRGMPPYFIGDFLEYVESLQIFKDFHIPIKREPAKLQKIVHQYKRIVADLKPQISKKKGEYYGRIIYFTGNNDFQYYSCFWDINRIKKHIKKNPRRIYEIPVKVLWASVDKAEIDWRYVEKRNNKEPVILVNFNPINELFVIDGNHRVAKQVRKSPNSTMRAVVLTEEEQLRFMAADYCRILYAIHQNITTTINYIAGARDDLPLLDVQYD